jgi:uncharacterized membrane protein
VFESIDQGDNLMAEKPGSNLVVLTFEGSETAEALYEQIEKMEKEKLLVVDDAIIIERGPDAARMHVSPGGATASGIATPTGNEGKSAQVTVKQTRGKKGKYAAIGGGIGLLAGAILGGPIGLMAVGAASIGAIAAAMKDFGVDDKSIEGVKQRLQPNTSALMLLGHANDRDALVAKLREFNANVVMSSLDPAVERDLVERLQSQG